MSPLIAGVFMVVALAGSCISLGHALMRRADES